MAHLNTHRPPACAKSARSIPNFQNRYFRHRPTACAMSARSETLHKIVEHADAKNSPRDANVVQKPQNARNHAQNGCRNDEYHPRRHLEIGSFLERAICRRHQPRLFLVRLHTAILILLPTSTWAFVVSTRHRRAYRLRLWRLFHMVMVMHDAISMHYTKKIPCPLRLEQGWRTRAYGNKDPRTSL